MPIVCSVQASVCESARGVATERNYRLERVIRVADHVPDDVLRVRHVTGMRAVLRCSKSVLKIASRFTMSVSI